MVGRRATPAGFGVGAFEGTRCGCCVGYFPHHGSNEGGKPPLPLSLQLPLPFPHSDLWGGALGVLGVGNPQPAPVKISISPFTVFMGPPNNTSVHRSPFDHDLCGLMLDPRMVDRYLCLLSRSDVSFSSGENGQSILLVLLTPRECSLQGSSVLIFMSCLCNSEPFLCMEVF